MITETSEIFDLVGDVLDDKTMLHLSNLLDEAPEMDEGTDRTQLSYGQSGIYILYKTEDRRVTTIAVFHNSSSRWSGLTFSRPLPKGLKFGMSREEALQLLGRPEFSGNAWLKWCDAQRFYRLGFSASGSLVSLDVSPR